MDDFEEPSTDPRTLGMNPAHRGDENDSGALANLALVAWSMNT
jgi:hypothetical protein